MQVDSKKVKKALATIKDVLLDLGIEDFVLSTLTEDKDGKVKYHTALVGSDVTVAHILMNLEEDAPEEVKNHITGHKVKKLFEDLKGDQDEI